MDDHVLVRMKKEDVDFLKGMAIELETQDNRGTSDPYFYVVQQTRPFRLRRAPGEG
jgi:hypothetical protein